MSNMENLTSPDMVLKSVI